MQFARPCKASHGQPKWNSVLSHFMGVVKMVISVSNHNIDSINSKKSTNGRFVANYSRENTIINNGSVNNNTEENETFSQVALKARAFLDAGYKNLGKVADDRTTGDEWRDKVQLTKLDRRSLYAIASNEGGLFSQAEISAASFPVEELHTKSTRAANRFGNDPAAVFKASIDLMDGASPEEKASLKWIQGRAAAQAGYESLMRDRHPDRVPADVKTHNPIIDLFATAWEELSSKRYGTHSVEDMPSWSKALSQWHIHNEGSAQSRTIGYL